MVSGIAQCSLEFMENLTSSSSRYEKKILFSTVIMQCFKYIPVYMKHDSFLSGTVMPQTL